MPRLCSDVRMSVVRKWRKKISFTTKSSIDLHAQADHGVMSMIKNCCSKKIADETLISTTTTKCGTTQQAANISVAAANNFEMPPKRALRAAMLKQRFADTIFKATHQQIQGSCNNNTKQERSELLKEKIKTKRRIEAEFKAAKKARFNAHSKKTKTTTLENQRAAARMALEKMEKSVHIDNDNAGFLKELQASLGDSVAYDLFYSRNFNIDTPLEVDFKQISLQFTDEGELLL